MGGTTKLNSKQFATLQNSVEEFGSFVDLTINPIANKAVRVDLRTPFGTLSFYIDQHGKRTPAAAS